MSSVAPDLAKRIAATIRATAAEREVNGGDLRTQLRAAWPLLSADVRVDGLHVLPREQAEEFFSELPPADRAQLLSTIRPAERADWLRLLQPPAAADVIQQVPEAERPALLELLDDTTRADVTALLAYSDHEAGGMMSTRFARLRPNMSSDEAVAYLRVQARGAAETIYMAYVLDPEQKLVGVVSLRELLAAEARTSVEELMTREVVKLGVRDDRDAVARVFASHDLAALPVVDSTNTLVGVVTSKQLVGAVVAEATEDAQRLGGTRPVATHYLETTRAVALRHRIGWLALLLAVSMLTATLLESFAGALDNVPALALFLPLIVRAGGNSGSQTAALIVRALAIGEIRRADWKRILKRELVNGLVLGLVLGAVVLGRVALWGSWGRYGDNFLAIAMIAGLGVVGCVTVGAITGAMLPFVLRRYGADPASASAPFVATLVDVFGILVYFGIANIVLLRFPL